MTLSDLVPQWAHQSVVVELSTGFDSYGNPSTGTASTYQAIIIQTNKMVRDRSGNQVVSSCQIFFPSTATVAHEAKITLPDGTQPPILNIGSYPDFDSTGIAALVVYT